MRNCLPVSATLFFIFKAALSGLVIALFHWRVSFLLSMLFGTAILAGATCLFGRVGIIR